MRELRIKDICDKGSSNLKQKDVENGKGKYPVYGASGIIGYIDTYHQEKEYISIVKDGSGIGRVSFMPAHSSIIGTLQYILPKEGYNIKYISYCLQSLNLSEYKQGAAIPHIYFRDYGEFVVKVEENIAEQERIVALLDAEFEKIEAIKANAASQLQAAKDLFQAALKENLTPKEGWEDYTINDVISDLRTGLNPRVHFKLNTPDADCYYITVRELKGFSIEIDEKTDLVNKDAIVRINQRSHLQIGDVLFSATGTIGNTALIKEIPQNWNIKEGIYVMTPHKEMLDSKYFIYLLSSDYFLKSVRAKAEGTGVKSIAMKNLIKLPVSLPPLSEQERIAARLDAISEKVKALQANYDKTITLCNDLKQSLLKSIFA
jgi:type I restriction enzyme S subunit